jgi:lysophospholipase L1-like esterase
LRIGAWLSVLVASVALEPIPAESAPSQVAGDAVLILDGTVTGGAASIEGAEAAAQGLRVDIVDAAAWSAMTTDQFAAYRAIILGDPTCQGLNPDIEAAMANASTWGPVIDGNIVITGTDPVFHASQGGATLTQRAVDFAVAQPGKTGAYISLSCYYHDTPSGTAVPLLDGIGGGGFTVTGVGCYNSAHIVADSPALASLTDADLSNWSCSVHEGFQTWPGGLIPLAIARDFDSSFTASDGSQGPPYILAGGDIRSFPLSISPLSSTGSAGGPHTVTAELLDGVTRLPVVGAKLLFSIVSGPNAGGTGSCAPVTCVTTADGQVAWTYRSNGQAGDETIRVAYDVNGNGAVDVGEPQTTAGQHWTAVVVEVDYVALGDSYASGEGTFTYDVHREAQNCHRGPDAWPRVIERRVVEIPRIEHKACTGAKSPQLLEPYKGNPAQILPTSPNFGVELVTLTIGGNDVGFAGILKDCYLPGGTCADDPGSRGFNNKLRGMKARLLNDIYPAVELAYPNAQIVHVGYPRLTPEPGVQPFRCGWLGADEQVAGVELARKLNGAIAEAAAVNPRVEFIDITDSLDGHELCTGDSWMVDVSTFGGTERGHPNARGQAAMAQSVATQLGYSFVPEF